MKKQILLSILTIGIVAAFLSAGTFAYFSDIETSTGNTFTVGIGPDLMIRDQDESWQNGVPVTATWTATDMKPGNLFVFCIPFIGLANVGSAADHLEITCNYSVDETANPVESDTDPNTNLHPDEMAKEMIITGCIYYDSVWAIDCLEGKKYDAYGPDSNGCTVVQGNVIEQRDEWKIEDQSPIDGKISFYDLKNDPLDDLPPPNGYTHFEMSVKFSDDANNDFQGDTFDLTMIFTLN